MNFLPGAVLGKAMTALTQGKGLVLVLVTVFAALPMYNRVARVPRMIIGKIIRRDLVFFHTHPIHERIFRF
jgi:hypothetical protein